MRARRVPKAALIGMVAASALSVLASFVRDPVSSLEGIGGLVALILGLWVWGEHARRRHLRPGDVAAVISAAKGKELIRLFPQLQDRLAPKSFANAYLLLSPDGLEWRPRRHARRAGVPEMKWSWSEVDRIEFVRVPGPLSPAVLGVCLRNGRKVLLHAHRKGTAEAIAAAGGHVVVSRASYGEAELRVFGDIGAIAANGSQGDSSSAGSTNPAE